MCKETLTNLSDLYETLRDINSDIKDLYMRSETLSYKSFIKKKRLREQVNKRESSE